MSLKIWKDGWEIKKVFEKEDINGFWNFETGIHESEYEWLWI